MRTAAAGPLRVSRFAIDDDLRSPSIWTCVPEFHGGSRRYATSICMAFSYVKLGFAPVAQLDRASHYGSEGLRLKSSWARLPSSRICLSNNLCRFKNLRMAGQGSTGNVIAALCSFFIPGLGQLVQGRLLMAIIQFCLAAVLWFVLLGWLIHLWSILDAALYKPRA